MWATVAVLDKAEKVRVNESEVPDASSVAVKVPRPFVRIGGTSRNPFNLALKSPSSSAETDEVPIRMSAHAAVRLCSLIMNPPAWLGALHVRRYSPSGSISDPLL